MRTVTVGHASALKAQARGARQRYPGEPQGRTLNHTFVPFYVGGMARNFMTLHALCIYAFSIRFRCPCNHRSTERGASSLLRVFSGRGISMDVTLRRCCPDDVTAPGSGSLTILCCGSGRAGSARINVLMDWLRGTLSTCVRPGKDPIWTVADARDTNKSDRAS